MQNKHVRPRVDIRILSHNRCDYLREAINSVLLQNINDYVLTVSDNSDNDQVEFMMSQEFPQLSYIKRDPMLNVIQHFQINVQESKCEFIMLLHDDDRLCPDFLEKQLRILGNNINIVALSCNGHVIKENGIRNNRYVLPFGKELETFCRSSQIAMKYARNSCLPLSPAIYRLTKIYNISIRSELGKVFDAGLFCDLADAGVVALNPIPLYECRVHSGQDSAYFPIHLMDKLELFFESRHCVSDSERLKLLSQLKRHHTDRHLKYALRELMKGNYRQINVLFSNNKVTLLNLIYSCYVFIINKFKF